MGLEVLLHHSEPVDPTLLQWIQGVIEHIFGTGPAPVVSVIGVLIVVVPLGLSFLAWRRLRRYGGRR